MVRSITVPGGACPRNTVEAQIDGYTLADEVENLVLAASTEAGTGNALANTLTGNANNNRLDGAGGADTMQGGLGDDVYVVETSLDKAIELAGAGFDTVESSVSLVLGANLEKLVLTDLGPTLNINATGNGLANTLIGNDGNNVLNGGVGATLAGACASATVAIAPTRPSAMIGASTALLRPNVLMRGLRGFTMPRREDR